MTKLKFCGAANEVTGSNHVLECPGVTVIVDCGFFQGVKVCDIKNTEPFSYDVPAADALFVTHAHLDHVGRIPKLFNEGFKGKIYSTPPTREIARLILDDTLRIIATEAKEDNHEPLFLEDAVHRTFENWETVSYEKVIELPDGLSARFLDAGHILGSAMVEFTRNGKKIVFSGDLGNSPSPLLPDTAPLPAIDYLVTEATYGDRAHEDLSERTNQLKAVIEDTIKSQGVLMVPAFSVERTQDLLLELNDMVEGNQIPEVPIFVDSPLAIRVTKVYSLHTDYFNQETKDQIKGGDDIFKFAKLRFTERANDSIAIKAVPAPKIILAGSGMSNGGRIMHHEQNYLPDPKNTLLIVGYQAVGTTGRMIEEGIKNVKIYNQDIPVRAKVVTINGYSAHKDMNALVDFVSEAKDTLKKVFVVHAELGAGLFFAQRIRDYLSIEAVVPKRGDVVEIDF
jgi:metallo-beta-lactamase family protein